MPKHRQWEEYNKHPCTHQPASTIIHPGPIISPPILNHAHPQLLNYLNANPTILLFYHGKNNKNKILRRTGNTNLHSHRLNWVLEAFFRWVMHSQFTTSLTPRGIWISGGLKKAKEATLIVFSVHKPVRQELFLAILSHPSKDTHSKHTECF